MKYLLKEYNNQILYTSSDKKSPLNIEDFRRSPSFE